MTSLFERKICERLMKKLRAMTEHEYSCWLEDAMEIWKTKPTLEDLYQREKIRKLSLEDFRFRQIHSDGLEEWRKKHNQS